MGLLFTSVVTFLFNLVCFFGVRPLADNPPAAESAVEPVHPTEAPTDLGLGELQRG